MSACLSALIKSELHFQHRMPGVFQLSPDDFHDAFQDLLLDFSDLPHGSFCPARPSQQHINDRKCQRQIDFDGRRNSHGAKRHGHQVSHLGDALQELAIIELLRRHQIDFERQPQVGAERMGKISRKKLVQLAYRAELLLGDAGRLAKIAGRQGALPGRGPSVSRLRRPCAARKRASISSWVRIFSMTTPWRRSGWEADHPFAGERSRSSPSF